MTNNKSQFSLVLVIGLMLPMVFGCEQRSQSPEVQLPDHISFNFDIRPILSDNCYICHGPDSSSRQAGLRLDLREYATMKNGEGRTAVNPGNWKKSELIRRITSSDPEVMMPPPQMKSTLDAREIELLKQWIQDGAKWEPYWAFQPPDYHGIPSEVSSRYVDNDIDRFLVDKLESSNLEPATITDKNTLVRRLSYVLTGLPPDQSVVRSFLENETANAYEQLVDFYLDSPRFGEQWARHWMDLVRYADTRGHEFDYKVIGAWQYRDYLIRAFNQDVPYDQLVLEHLAGDLLAHPRLNPEQGYNESVIGTAFFCLTEGKHSPVDLRVDQSERIDNIIDVTSKTFQALTVACAKCHDHKFDPIPTTDYYAMYGMIESTRFTLTPAGFDQEDQLIFDSLKQNPQEIKQFISGKVNVPDALPSTSSSEVTFQGDYQVLGDFRDGTLNGWTTDGLAFSNSLGVPITEHGRVVGLESGKASSKVMGQGLFGVLRSPDFEITGDSMLFRAAGKNSVVRVIIDNFQLIQDPIYGQLQTHIKSQQLQDYKIDVSMWKGHRAYLELLVGDYMRRKDKGSHEYDLNSEAWLEMAYAIGYDSLLVMDPGGTNLIRPQRSASAVFSAWMKGTATPVEIDQLSKWFSQRQPYLNTIEDFERKRERRVASLHDTLFVVGVTDGENIQSPVFIRGSLKNLSSYRVPHRFLHALSDTAQIFADQGSGRMEFARHIASSDNPLTARVMVNRIWHHVFGRGLVETVDNFGVQGKIPSHPRLLDYLALKFVEEGWSIKAMIRYMVMSQAFQRSTDASADSEVMDPENVLLQHYPVRRLNAESIRDAVLATSGRLDTSMFGPPIPVYLTEFLNGRGKPRKSGPLDGDGRRSIYQALHRNFLPPMLLAFDMPVPFSTFGKRNVSNVPSQSLTLLNDPFVAEQAEYWARKVVEEDNDFEKKISQIYTRAFARTPENVEIEQAHRFFQEQLALYQDLENQQEIELELWKSYCHSIFNMKEFIFLI